jgi:hypothetical protein
MTQFFDGVKGIYNKTALGHGFRIYAFAGSEEGENYPMRSSFVFLILLKSGFYLTGG